MLTESASQFDFDLQYVNDEGNVVRQERLQPAIFQRAIDSTRFDALRRGRIADYQPQTRAASITPLFPEGDASPRAKGFSVTVPLPAGREHTCRFNLSYFRSSANRLRAELLRAKVMTSEQGLHYRLNAYLDEEACTNVANALGISIEPAASRLAMDAARRRDFGPVQAWDAPNEADVPVLVDVAVLEEAAEEARANPNCEVAGFLLGHLHRDHESREVFVAVTGLASAGGTTVASGTSVTFTPASFAQIREIIRLRGGSESVVGWYHSHPFQLCAECPLPTPPDCIAKILFYSLDDMHLMETTFEQPYMVGLLAATDPRIETAIGHLPVKLYGWRDGEIAERGFEVFSPPTRSGGQAQPDRRNGSRSGAT